MAPALSSTVKKWYVIFRSNLLVFPFAKHFLKSFSFSPSASPLTGERVVPFLGIIKFVQLPKLDEKSS